MLADSKSLPSAFKAFIHSNLELEELKRQFYYAGDVQRLPD
jgi:hypothetical protein